MSLGVNKQIPLVRLFILRTLLNRLGANIQVVEAFDGRGEKHGT
jgi:hypothetical protein